MLTLTDEQQFIYDDLLSKVKSYPGRFECIIEGSAGTGKSTLTSRIIESLSTNYTVAVTSPTHKACSVIKNMVNSTNVDKENIREGTIHSFLGLKLQHQKTKQVLVVDTMSKMRKIYVDVLIVDECSMISDELYKHIVDNFFRVRRAIIFIGDRNQLPPVDESSSDEKLSPTFSVKMRYELSTVMRQALDNPILKMATDVRLCIPSGSNSFPLLYTAGLETIHQLTDDDSFLELYKTLIMENSSSSDKIHKFVENNKILAYTNYKVSCANMYIRNSIFDETREFVVGEPIVFESTTENCPFKSQEMIKCPEIEEDYFMGISCWKMNYGNGSFGYVVGPSSKVKYEEHMAQIVNNIEKGVINPLSKKPYVWQDYYVIREKINVLNYPYATTVHKSQGSTFENIWLDTYFIDRIGSYKTQSRILYTALTRPKFNVIMLVK